LGDLEANLDLRSLKCTLVKLKEEIVWRLACFEVGKGNIGLESFACHGKEALSEPRPTTYGKGHVILRVGLGAQDIDLTMAGAKE
jgi:hypothetical protein